MAGSEGVAELDGRRVYFATALAPYGSIAERTLLDPSTVFDVPEGLADEAAVSMGIAGLAGWLPLTYHAGVAGGERVLIVGATGVAGQVAVQAAKLLGAGHVVAAGRHTQTLEPLLERGADAIVTLDDHDPHSGVHNEAGDGFDVIVDYVYGERFTERLRHAAVGATIVVVGGSGGQDAPVAFRTLQGKRMIGHANWAVPLEVRREAFAAMAAHTLAGQLSIDVERFDLDDVVDAWEAQASSPHRKLVIAP